MRSLIPQRFLRTGRLLLSAAALVVLASCGGSSDAANSNYVDVNSAIEANDAQAAEAEQDAEAAAQSQDALQTGTSAGATSQTGATNGVSSTEFQEIADAFEQFLWLRSNAVMGDIAVSDLAGLATDQAMAQVSDLNEINVNLLETENISAVRAIMEWPNVTTIELAEGRYSFIDCTERQQTNLNQNTEVFFVTNAVEVVKSDGVYKVDQVQELQNGRYGLATGEYGCVPPSFIERAEAVVATAIEQASAATSDPAAALAAGLSPVFADEARSDLERALGFLDERGLSRDANEEVSFQVVGMDINDHDYTVIVSVCRFYPTGRFYVDTATGEAELPDIASGGSQEEWISVHLEPVASGTQTADVAVTVEAQDNLNCWRG